MKISNFKKYTTIDANPNSDLKMEKNKVMIILRIYVTEIGKSTVTASQ